LRQLAIWLKIISKQKAAKKCCYDESAVAASNRRCLYSAQAN
jgi:hypothetical protein